MIDVDNSAHSTCCRSSSAMMCSPSQWMPLSLQKQRGASRETSRRKRLCSGKLLSTVCSDRAWVISLRLMHAHECLRRKERSQNYAPRSIRLPPTADLTKTKAQFIDGTLILIIPKKELPVRHLPDQKCSHNASLHKHPVMAAAVCIWSACAQLLPVHSISASEAHCGCRRRKTKSARLRCSRIVKTQTNDSS